MTQILDPTDERVPVSRRPTQRPERLRGTLALLDINKPRGNVLLDQLERRLAARLPQVAIKRYSKPTFTKPAPEDLRRRIAGESDFVIEALAD